MARPFESPATSLAQALARGELSSEEVVRSHLDRIAEADGHIRAFTAVFRDEALAAARRADEERRRGEVRGALHGLPVSVKESIEMAGRASTMSVPARQRIVAQRDAPIVQLLREAGAVILGRTNVPQLLISHECDSPLFGRTANPWSLAHAPGGSSGGESAAIAAGMSPLGIGTDLGGSIRVPAAWTGIAGLKPTLDRWPSRGSSTAMPGQEASRAMMGPMARTSRDVALLMGAFDMRRMSELDGRVPPLPIGEPERIDLRGIRVGVFVDDGFVPASTSVARAVRRAAQALRDRVAGTVDFAPPGAMRAVYAYFAALSADGGKTAFSHFEGGPSAESLESLKSTSRMSPIVRRIVARTARLFGEERVAGMLDVLGEKTVTDYWRLVAELRSYRFTFLEAMDAAGIDAIVCPAHATPAVPHGRSYDFLLAGTASMLFNLLQLPAGVVPVGRVRTDETTRPGPKGRLEARAAEVDSRSAGLPLGVQIVARPWREDVVLALMIAVDDAVRADAEFPITPHCAP